VRLDVELPPRLVDASVLVAVALALLTGLGSLLATPAEWWVFVAHGAVGLTLVVLLVWKLRRVVPRIRAGVRARSPTVALSVVLALFALATLATGTAWTFGLVAGVDLAGWTVLNLHIGLALVTLVLVVVHLARRFRAPTRADWEGRRTALQYAGLVAGGVLAWKVSEAVGGVVGDRRFTGSRREGGEGNDFPVTSWMLDDPDPVDAGAWRLHVVGLVDTPLELGYGDLPTAAGEVAVDLPPVAERATLDCTSGWYAEREWTGVRVGDLLDAAGACADARHVVFHSVTGYRFGFPIEEARDAVLATRVDGDVLSHGHGFPLRVVAPGRRGFQWVKWVTAVEIRRTRDLGSWIAIFASGLS